MDLGLQFVTNVTMSGIQRGLHMELDKLAFRCLTCWRQVTEKEPMFHKAKRCCKKCYDKYKRFDKTLHHLEDFEWDV